MQTANDGDDDDDDSAKGPFIIYTGVGTEEKCFLVKKNLLSNSNGDQKTSTKQFLGKKYFTQPHL